jgi:hypothetical protein
MTPLEYLAIGGFLHALLPDLAAVADDAHAFKIQLSLRISEQLSDKLRTKQG